MHSKAQVAVTDNKNCSEESTEDIASEQGVKLAAQQGTSGEVSCQYCRSIPHTVIILTRRHFASISTNLGYSSTVKIISAYFHSTSPAVLCLTPSVSDKVIAHIIQNEHDNNSCCPQDLSIDK